MSLWMNYYYYEMQSSSRILFISVPACLLSFVAEIPFAKLRILLSEWVASALLAILPHPSLQSSLCLMRRTARRYGTNGKGAGLYLGYARSNGRAVISRVALVLSDSRMR